jgi:hypothetical protein
LTQRALACVAAVVLALATTVTSVAHADQAPMWESPEGLAPGAPNTRVQMSAEDVHIQVRDKDGKAYASVDAVFDMLNPGASTQMLVGFPSFASSAIPSDISQPYSQVMFQASSLNNFRASSPLGQYVASARIIKVGEFSNSEWYVWSMQFPAGKPLQVHVSYDQQLDGYSWAWVSYVLRTGALWDGPIGRATVTMTAPDGGGLLGGDPMPETSDGSLTWTMTNFKPTRDIDATYVPAALWAPFQRSVAAASAPTPSSGDLVDGAQAVLDVMFGRDRPSSNFRRSLRGQPSILADHYFVLARVWAQLATDMDPSNAAAWETVGDVAAMAATDRRGGLYCWPTSAVDAYLQAAGLGSPSADSKNSEMSDVREEQGRSFGQEIQDCVD